MSNYLKKETSVYLQEYLNTPVNWYPWGEAALGRAKQEHKPIFLSIGYSGSYWCEVMKEESFKSSIISELLNAHFIAIKVDKDERTDLDKYYKQTYRLMNGQNCASPISIFLTEDLEPFYSAAYIAPYPKGNVLGFEALLRVIVDKYRTDKITMKKKGQEVLHFLTQKKPTLEATRLNHAILVKTITLHAHNLFDTAYGGFGKEPKFLNLSLLELLLDVYEETQDSELFSMVKITLHTLYHAEIHDKHQGGFYHYANRNDWNLPREEKMSYDNAQLAALYGRMFHLSGDLFYKTVALETVQFMLTQMRDHKLFYTNSVIKNNGEQLTDTKQVTSFNAMMIDALLTLSQEESRYEQIGLETLEALLEYALIDNQLYHTRGIKGFLEDYAYLGITLIKNYQITQNPQYLILSETLANQAIEKFYAYGSWKFSSLTPTVYDDMYDPLYPSAMATMLLFLHQLSFFVESDYNPLVFTTLERHSYQIMRQPLSAPKMSKVVLQHLKKML